MTTLPTAMTPQWHFPPPDPYALAEREAIQAEGCELTVFVAAHELLNTLRRKGAVFELCPRGLNVTGVRLSDVDARLVNRHKVMLTRWTLASWIEERTGVEVDIAEWDGAALPDPEWFSSRPRLAYQVVPSNLGAPTPELEGFWALVCDHLPASSGRPGEQPWVS